MHSSSSLCFSLPTPSNDHQKTLIPKPISLFKKHPLHIQLDTNLSLQFKEKIFCLELIGVDSSKALSQNPSLHQATLQSINSVITFLQSKGIHENDLGRIFGMCPKILTSNIECDLNPVFNFLSNDLNVPQISFRRVIKKCPRLLVSVVNDQLKPALFYLQSLGFKDMQALVYNDPVLLVSNVENTLIPKMEFLMSLGFSRDDVVGMILRCPSLLTFSVENNFKPKFDFFCGEMEGNLEDLKGFPQYFAFSLEKRIKPRYFEVVQSGVKVSLPMMLKTTNEEFLELLIHKEMDERKKGYF